MKVKFDKILALKVLIILLMTNYMVVTILLDDMIILKYLRDIILVTLFGLNVLNKKIAKFEMGWICFIFLLLLAFIRSDNMPLAIVSIRRYVFPIIALITIKHFSSITKEKFNRVVDFLLIFFALISLWGVFQAWVLKDDFLKSIGYVTSYSYGYGRDMLNYSFYFGGLGIQRVVSTLSNANICGLVLGTTLLFLIFLYPYINNEKKNIYILLMLIGYVLTFSRSNFLALLIVVILIMYPYIPHKNVIWGCIGVGLLACIALFFIQGENGLIYKLWGWVINTLTLSESSVAGRSSRWTIAFLAAMRNPWGIGFGHVGALAIDAGVADAMDCENSYLAIAIDSGVLGMILYVFCICSLILKFSKYKKMCSNNEGLEKRICLCGKSMLIYMLVTMFFSNHIYDMEAIALIFIYVGILLNILKNNTCTAINAVS